MTAGELPAGPGGLPLPAVRRHQRLRLFVTAPGRVVAATTLLATTLLATTLLATTLLATTLLATTLLATTLPVAVVPGDGARLREDLLVAAAAMVDERGNLEGVGLRAVAGAAGVTPNAVYRHFADHDELLRATVDWCWDQFAVAVIDRVAAGDDPYERLKASGEAYVAFAAEHRGWYRLMFSDSQLLPDDRDPPWQIAFQGLVDLVGDVLEANGDDRDPFQVAIQIQSWTHGIVDLCTGDVPPMPGWPTASELMDAVGERLGLEGLTPIDES